jgi:hypothetical protein
MEYLGQLLPQGYPQQPPLSSQNHVQPATERQPFNDYTPLLSLYSYDQGSYLTSQGVQPYGNTAMFYQRSFTPGQISLSIGQNPATAVIQSHQLQIADGTNSVPVQPMAPPPKPRKRKAPTLRRDKWEPVKARAIELHISQKLPLPEVQKTVEEEFKSSGFTAT